MIVTEFDGLPIDLNTESGRFSVELDGAVVSRPQLQDLQDLIAHWRKERAKAEPLDLPVVWRNGAGTITGINLANGQYTGLGRGVTRPGFVWVRHPRVEAMLKEVERLQAQVGEIMLELQQYGFPTKGVLVDAHDYQEAVRELREEWENKMRLADEQLADERKEAA